MAVVATDAFTNSNGTQLTSHSSDWTLNTGDFDIQSNACAVDVDDEAGAHWNADAFDDAQYSEGVIAALNANKYVGVAVRAANSGATYYGLYGDNGDAAYLFKQITGSWTELGSGDTYSVSDVVALEADGTTITPKKNGSLDASIGAKTDSAIASGSAGLCGYDDGDAPASIDDWEGGNLAEDEGVDIEVPVGALTLTGYAPTIAVTANVNITVPVAALNLTGYVPTIQTPVGITIPVAALTLTGYAPTVAISNNVNIEVPVAALTLTGYVPIITTTAHVDIEVPVAALTLTGYAPTVTTTGHVDVTVPVAALTLTGYAPTVSITTGVDIEIPVAALTLTGYAPTVTATAHIDIEIPVAALTFTGYAPTVGVGITVEVPVAALTLTGYAPTVATTAHVDIEIPVAVLELTGYAPLVVGVRPARGPDPVWDRYKREDFPELPHVPEVRKSSQQEITERWNEKRREIEKQERVMAEAATLDEMAVDRVDVYLENEEADKVQAGVRRRQSMINLEKGKIMGERVARKKEETDKIRNKNLAKGRRKLRRIRKKK